MPRTFLRWCRGKVFLSIQAQDFIEENRSSISGSETYTFLSIQAQDFIEDRKRRGYMGRMVIPEHSSSGLH